MRMILSYLYSIMEILRIKKKIEGLLKGEKNQRAVTGNRTL